jgi:hypothetical protein
VLGMGSNGNMISTYVALARPMRIMICVKRADPTSTCYQKELAIIFSTTCTETVVSYIPL